MSRLYCWWSGHIWTIWRTAMHGRDLIAERSCHRCSKQEVKDAWV